MKKIAVLGAGAWGTAISTVLADNGHTVLLWSHESSVIEDISKNRVNSTYLPTVTLSKNIRAVSSLEEVLSNTEWVFEAVPVKYLRSVLEQCIPFYKNNQNWIVLSKGIESESLLLPTEIIDDVFQSTVMKAVVSGPSFAKDLSQKQHTGVSSGSDHVSILNELDIILSTNYLTLFHSQDVKGIQLVAAVKNVIALGVGILDGADYADNTKILFVMNMLSECELLLERVGGKKSTLYGFAGIGDIMLTALGKESKNLSLGKKVGQGHLLNDIENEVGALPEGINTLNSIITLIKKYNLSSPILISIYDVLYGKISISKWVLSIMLKK